MTAPHLRRVRAAGYREQALAATALADAALLANVREKHEHAAERWTALALMDEQPSSHRTPAPDAAAEPLPPLKDGATCTA